MAEARMQRGQARFCRANDGVRIVYAVHGEGPPILITKTWISHLQYDREDPMLRHLLEALGRTATVARYDERGYGLSDWDAEDLSLEARVGDLEAVADAAGFERYAVMGMGQGGQVVISHAARRPERVTRMILSNTYAGVTDEYRARFEAYFETLVQLVRFGWTLPDSRFRRVFSESLIPGGTEAQKRWLDDIQPRCTSRDTAIRAALARRDLDVTSLLAEVRAPTLVLQARGNRMAPFEQGRLMASTIPNAQFVPLESDNSSPLPTEPAWPLWLEAVTRFLATDRSSTVPRTFRTEPVEELTEREVELLHLVAEGLRNDEIAERLTLSARTVERHLSNIYRKLGVSGRSARAAAVAHVLQR